MSTLLVIDQGDDEVLDITVRAANGTASDLTGWTLWFYVKRSKTDADEDALLKKTTGDGIAHTAPESGGLATVTIDADETASLVAGDTNKELYWVCQGQGPDSKVITLARGRMVIQADLLELAGA